MAPPDDRRTHGFCLANGWNTWRLTAVPPLFQLGALFRRPPLAPEWPKASREWLRRPPRETLLRKTTLALVIVGLLWIGYIAWPLRDLAVLVQAIDAHDITSVLDHVNFDRVRVSLAEQVAAASARRSGIQSIPIPQQAIVAGLTIADPVINKLVSPEALSEFLAAGWPIAIAGKPPPGTIGINRQTLGTAWQIFRASHYGLGRFEASAPIDLAPANRFRLRFDLLAWRWQLAGVILPEHLQDLIADQVMKAVRERR